ncbi:hypothetical protein WDV06_16640 [Streptomyces racemochromogenes]|uniref:STAS domain-containing protein n=1 Tax=Streptomyces racemochromogenes TaxID=67353 RepID=A0ABW7PEB2_9ACTN
MAASVAYTPKAGQPPAHPYLATSVDGGGGRTVVCVAGSIDDVDVPDLLATCEAALTASPAGIDLDLARVTFCAPGARTALTGYWERVRAGGPVVLVTAAGPAFRPLVPAPAGPADRAGGVRAVDVTASLASSGFPLGSTPAQPGVDVREDGRGGVAVSWNAHDGGRPAHAIQRTVRAALRAALDAAGYETVPHGNVLTVGRRRDGGR